MIVGIQLIFETKHQATIFEIKKYQSIIESLMYAMIQIKSNIVFVVIVFSRFSLNFNKQHFMMTKHVFCYLRKFLNVDIIYENNNSLINYIDAN